MGRRSACGIGAKVAPANYSCNLFQRRRDDRVTRGQHSLLRHQSAGERHAVPELSRGGRLGGRCFNKAGSCSEDFRPHRGPGVGDHELRRHRRRLRRDRHRAGVLHRHLREGRATARSDGSALRPLVGAAAWPSRHWCVYASAALRPEWATLGPHLGSIPGEADAHIRGACPPQAGAPAAPGGMGHGRRPDVRGYRSFPLRGCAARRRASLALSRANRRGSGGG